MTKMATLLMATMTMTMIWIRGRNVETGTMKSYVSQFLLCSVGVTRGADSVLHGSNATRQVNAEVRRIWPAQGDIWVKERKKERKK